MFHIRKMTVALVLWSAFALYLVIHGLARTHCGVNGTAYHAGCAAGTGIAVFGIIALWFFGFVVLSLIWFMSRPKGQQ